MLELSVPARQDMLLVIRMTLSGLCARCGMGLDEVENARIASDEACYCLLNQSAAVERLRMICEWTDERLDIIMEAIRPTAAEPRETAHDPEIARCILETLIGDVRLSHDALGVYAIHMGLEVGTLREARNGGGTDGV
ncbi:MAG: hypothetical protein LBS72_02860 [Oscillospiraceae bacterium]|jgi:serine/threonine-protein kinase RsbW|nr:hypothetical protein [Oscillospiraceae bacterium]